MAALTKLQSEVLRRFFERRRDFFLTGGGALVGFHLRHRITHDLDLFTVGDMIDDAERTLGEIVTELGARSRKERRPCQRIPACVDSVDVPDSGKRCRVARRFAR